MALLDHLNHFLGHKGNSLHDNSLHDNSFHAVQTKSLIHQSQDNALNLGQSKSLIHQNKDEHSNVSLSGGIHNDKLLNGNMHYDHGQFSANFNGSYCVSGNVNFQWHY